MPWTSLGTPAVDGSLIKRDGDTARVPSYAFYDRRAGRRSSPVATPGYDGTPTFEYPQPDGYLSLDLVRMNGSWYVNDRHWSSCSPATAAGCARTVPSPPHGGAGGDRLR